MAALSSYMSQYATLNADITASISKINRWSQGDSTTTEESDDDIGRHYQGIEKNFEEMEELFEQVGSLSSSKMSRQLCNQ